MLITGVTRNDSRISTIFRQIIAELNVAFNLLSHLDTAGLISFDGGSAVCGTAHIFTAFAYSFFLKIHHKELIKPLHIVCLRLTRLGRWSNLGSLGTRTFGTMGLSGIYFG